jgi:hypothetical protein
MTAAGLVCGACGTELPPNAKSYNESAVPELPGPVDRLAAAPCSGSTGFLVTVRQRPPQNVGAGRSSRQTGCQGVCLVDGCDARVYARGRCRKQYRRFMHENRTEEQQLHDREYERNRGQDKEHNPAKTTRCSGCGKLCWRSDKRKRDEGHLSSSRQPAGRLLAADAPRPALSDSLKCHPHPAPGQADGAPDFAAVPALVIQHHDQLVSAGGTHLRRNRRPHPRLQLR